jgi:hypothetical protein
MAMPTEQITTYFHDASSDPRVRRCPTKKVVTMVGGLHRHPHDPDVAGHHRQEHGGDKPLDQYGVQGGVAPATATGDYLGVEVTHALPRREETDHPDNDDHEGAEGIDTQRSAESDDR